MCIRDSEESNLVDIGTGIGIAVLVAMFFGSIIGGMLGARWHTKLERRAAERHVVHDTGDQQRHEDDDRSAEERRRLSQRAEERRQTEATPTAAPSPPGQTTQPNEPVVTNHGTATGSQPVAPQTSTRTAPADAQTTTEKPSIKDRLTGKG